MPFTLQSASFGSGEPIPARHTCDAANISPALSWAGAPPETQSFALICDDPDAPNGTFTHWVLYNLPAETTALPEHYRGAEHRGGAAPSRGGQHGQNDFGEAKYGGPCPPPTAKHRYFFHLYALDSTLDLPTGASREAVEEALSGHILAETELMGIYRRSDNM